MALTLIALSGCHRAFRPPSEDEPRARIHLRRSYPALAGAQLSERSVVNGTSALREQMPSTLAFAPQETALWMRPEPTRWVHRSEFWHSEYRAVTHNVYNAGYRTTYTTLELAKVVDGTCSARMQFTPEANHTYLIQYTYLGHRQCELDCFERFALPGGRFRQVACALDFEPK